MKQKKPLWRIFLLGSLLASVCIGFVFLATASVADPELYAKITDPVFSYLGEQMENLGITVNQMKEDANQFIEDKKEEYNTYLEEKEEEKRLEEEAIAKAIAEQDAQARAEAALAAPREAADPLITHFDTNPTSGQEILTGGANNFVYFNQTDEQWEKYGYDSINGYGCGPTAMAMIVSTLTDRQIDPQEMADIFYQEGFWASKSGTYYSFADGSGALFGLTVEHLDPETLTESQLISHLMAGKIAIALVSSGHFTSTGHYIVLRGATLSGDLLVADPASRERSIITWDPTLIIEELSASRYNGAPLWLFSVQYTTTPEEEYLIP